MKYTSIIIPFVGGLGMFIYGMQIMAQGLENAAGNRMKSLLEALTKNKFFGVLLGAFITAVIQSSSATTVMVVGFVNAGIMNLQQAMGVIMGANIGTTVTGWLVSSVEWAKFLSPSNLAPVAIMIGVIIMLTGKRRSTKDIASIVVGFGLLFVGISSMSSAVEPLKDNAAFCNIFVSLGHNPFLGIVAGAAVTAIIQSSSASVGILQSLAAAGLVPFGAAIYIIMGQNIGTCVTAILSSVGAKKNAKTAALMHLLFNIIGTVIFSIIAIAYLSIVNPAWAQGNITQTQISMVHTVFNIVTTVLLFPVSDWIIKLAKKIGHVEEEVQDESVVLLDDRMLETPGIAIQSTVSELVRMGHPTKCTSCPISRNTHAIPVSWQIGTFSLSAISKFSIMLSRTPLAISPSSHARHVLMAHFTSSGRCSFASIQSFSMTSVSLLTSTSRILVSSLLSFGDIHREVTYPFCIISKAPGTGNPLSIPGALFYILSILLALFVTSVFWKQ